MPYSLAHRAISFPAAWCPRFASLFWTLTWEEDQPKYLVLTVSEDLQRRGISRVAVRLYDDLRILIERHEEAQETLNGKLPKVARAASSIHRAGELRTKRLRNNLCRPYGTRSDSPLYPALKRWAKLCRPIRGWFLPASFHCRNRYQVATQSLKARTTRANRTHLLRNCSKR